MAVEIFRYDGLGIMPLKHQICTHHWPSQSPPAAHAYMHAPGKFRDTMAAFEGGGGESIQARMPTKRIPQGPDFDQGF